jgi:hypothetical protein
MSEPTPRSYKYNAQAKILHGNLVLPLVQEIHPQAHTQLPEEGGYRAAHSLDYRLEGVLSYEKAHSQVSGNAGVKPGQGWSTLTTTVIENLNILEVLTADRVVGQIITEHPLVGYVPTISFLGTRFENLRIAGHPVELDLDLNLLGDKPENDAPYASNAGVVSRVASQYERIRSHKELPAEVAERYNRLSSHLGSPEAVECSLINQASGGYPGTSFGHVIHIPHFGTITLAKLVVTHSNPHPETGVPKKTQLQLRMIELKLGCAIHGDLVLAENDPNGVPEP